MNNNKQWRQKWELMSKEGHTNTFFHTWHETEEVACQFVCEYVKSLGRPLPDVYYRPFELPTLHNNTLEEPIGVFHKTSERTPTFA